MNVRVRFAPSPTGHLHIGGVRTALFNWLFARHSGGTFILRIEDTDEVRSTEASVNAILQGLAWLGLDWDEGPASPQGAERGAHGPYFQYQRFERGFYREPVERLLRDGRAYRCYCTPEQVQKMRERARVLKQSPRYDGTCRDLTAAQQAAFGAAGRTHSVRFRMPADGTTAFADIIRGPQTWENAVMEDFVIQKTSGVPTYNFACVVDDHAMAITHVIRGDDHMSNTPRQIMAARALGWESPLFAHLPMILGADGARLSKRHGATAVEEYRQAGTLPDALVNYLALLGWSTEDSQQIFAPGELEKKFTLERCGKSPAIFDPAKLMWMNGDYIRRRTPQRLVEEARPWIAKAVFAEAAGRDEARLLAAVTLEQEKIKQLSDVPGRVDIFFQEVQFDPQAVEKVFAKPGGGDILRAAAAAYGALPEFTAASTEEASKAVASARGVKNGAVYHPVRVAVSGRTQGPSLFHMLEVFGREEVLRRLAAAQVFLASRAAETPS